MKIIIDNGAIMPTRAHDTDAGMDLYSPTDIVVPACKVERTDNEETVTLGAATIDIGVHVEIPRGHAGFLKSKSGLNVKHGITSEGVIDAGYTGSIVVKLYNATGKPYTVRVGDKISQLVILPIITPELEVVESLDATERGNGGFGSSGR